MEIVKELNLNKSPQSVKNNSLICAKNIKISTNGQYITNEDGVDAIFDTGDTFEKIVGVIPCNMELVIFTYNNSTKVSKIYRKSELDNKLIEVLSNWKWSYGIIKGTYSYNVNNELLIAIAEYKDGIDIPFKTLNLNTCSELDVDDYSIAPSIPRCNMRFIRNIVGLQMAKGLYYFFIRYEISNEIYTNWFPIGIPLVAANIKLETIIQHYYPKTENSDVSTFCAEPVNSGIDCLYNFELELYITNINKYLNYQIGYILQTDTKTVARTWKKFKLQEAQNTYNIVFNGDSSKEYSIDELLTSPYNIFNVRQLNNYNNRLYISNYKESNLNIDLKELASNIEVEYSIQSSNPIGVDESAIIYTTTAYGYFEKKLSVYKIGVLNLPSISFMEWYNFVYAPAYKVNTISDSVYLKDDLNRSVRVTNVRIFLIVNTNTLEVVNATDNVLTTSISNLTLYNFSGSTISTFNVSNFNFKDLILNIDNIGSIFNKGNENYKTLIPNQIYNFFVHYINADGSVTNGYRLSNNQNNTIQIGSKTYNINSILSQIVFDNDVPKYYLKLQSTPELRNKRLYEIFNNAKDNKFGYFININGEVLFKAPNVLGDPKGRLIGVNFTNIKIPKEYIGVTFSYEKVEPVVQYSAIVPDNAQTINLYNSDILITSKNYNGSLLIETYIQPNDSNGEYKDGADISYIRDISLKVADSAIDSNIGRESRIIASGDFTLTSTGTSKSIVTVLTLNNYVYSSKSKELVWLGQNLYKTSDVEINKTFSDTVFKTRLNYEGVIITDNVLVYNKNGVRITTEGIPQNNNGDPYTESYASVLTFGKYTTIPITLKQFKNKPEILVSRTYTTRTNLIVKPSQSDSLFEYKSDYIFNNYKVYQNYNSDLKIISEYNKTIRRSDIIQDESVYNSWRKFKADAYKIISENKGVITNIVGVGLYLLVHTEHSLFMFNRDASLKTQNKDVQLTIPDAFDTEYQEVFTSDKGYGGLQDSDAWCVNEFGYTFFDNSSKRIYNFDNGSLNIISLELNSLLNSIDISKVIIANDSKNNRILVCIKYTKDTIDNYYMTISYNYLTKSWISLHDYCFKDTYNTKENLYLSPISDSRKLYKFDNKRSIKLGDFKELEIPIDYIFPKYKSDMDDSCYSYVDIIFNEAFETPKVLNYIDYVLSEILDYESIYNQAEESNNFKYSGFKLLIYTDCTKTESLDINTGNVKNIFNNYKYPYFDKGKWNFNYFRNYIESNKSDYQSLIYGKYIVARFIFNTESNKRIKFENINFNVNKY